MFIELPWAFNLSGSYMGPYGIQFSGKYTARAGDPLVRTFQFGDLGTGTTKITGRVELHELRLHKLNQFDH